jgi:response regulator NasT
MTAPETATIRVLLAEDDDNARKLFTDLLATLGHTVVAAVATGAEAVNAVRDLAPDAVLLDVHMPDGSGIDAAKAIAQEAPGTAVMLFTGDAELTLSDEDAAGTGAIAFLSKPTPPTVLDSTLRLAVARARALSDARSDAERAKAQLEHRKLIERAKGLLMRRTGATEQEAYRIMQRTSQDRSVAMVEIAKAILASEPTG